MADFAIVHEISRREVERHQKRFIGVTINAPEHREIGGLLEWVCDVRVGYNNAWAAIKDVTISQWALGIVTDMNVPVLCERNEAGLVTIIARSEVRLPNIRLTTYSYNDLDFVFMGNLTLTGSTYLDGFGYAMTDPTTETGATINYDFIAQLIDWGGTEFVYGTTKVDGATYGWEEA